MKSEITDLALFGGTPAFRDPVPTNLPSPVDRDRLFERLNRAFDSHRLSNSGPLVCEFEARLAAMAGVGNCVAVCNATTGMQLLLRAAGLTGEVIVPSLTFPATAHAARWLGLDPVFCDIDPATGCIDPGLAARAITPRTAAIIGVHLWGRPCAVDALEKVGAEHGVPVFFDAAHAIGATTGGRPVGGFGTAEVYSFHATKTVSAFEGAAILTDDDAYAARIRALHNFGKGLQGVNEWGGTNGKMHEGSAAMGLTSLDALDEIIGRNRANYETYRAELAGVSLFALDLNERNNFQYVIADVGEASELGRDLLLEVLRAENVMALLPIGVPACHQLEPYRGRTGALPHTEALAARVVSLPSGSAVGPEEIRRICSIIHFAVTHGGEVSAAARAAAAA